MKMEDKDLKTLHTPLMGFAGEVVVLEGYVTLPVLFGMQPQQVQVMVDFVVVKASSPYNMILGHPTICTVRAVPFTYHMKMKFYTKNGVGEIKGNQQMVRQCYIASLKLKRKEVFPNWFINEVEEIDHKGNQLRSLKMCQSMKLLNSFESLKICLHEVLWTCQAWTSK